MSNQQTIASYSFNFNFNDPNFGNGISFLVSEQPGFGDADAFALQNAIMAALAKTAVLAPIGNVLKNQVVNTQYQTNATATPPSFT